MNNDLPTWEGPRGGSGCDNPDCDAGDRYVRVLSREEISRVYINPERLPMWPLPEQYTHMCTGCGMAYAGATEALGFEHGADASGRPEVPIEAWDWSEADAWDHTVREATRRFIEGVPTDEDGTPRVTAEQIVEGVDRHVPGADPELAREVLAASHVDVAADPATGYL